MAERRQTETLADVLVRVRDERGLTQEQFAAAAGLHRSQMQRYLSGAAIEKHTRDKIARRLKISLDDAGPLWDRKASRKRRKTNGLLDGPPESVSAKGIAESEKRHTRGADMNEAELLEQMYDRWERLSPAGRRIFLRMTTGGEPGQAPIKAVVGR